MQRKDYLKLIVVWLLAMSFIYLFTPYGWSVAELTWYWFWIVAFVWVGEGFEKMKKHKD